MTDQSPFVPDDFVIPDPLATDGWRLEVLGPEHNERDYAAWTSSIEFIRALPGFDEWDEWPPETPMSLEENLGDLVMHLEEYENREAFAYSVLEGSGGADAEVVGCLYINPTNRAKRPYQEGHDAQIRSWVRADRPDLDRELWAAVTDWLTEAWPFTNPRYHAR